MSTRPKLASNRSPNWAFMERFEVPDYDARPAGAVYRAIIHDRRPIPIGVALTEVMGQLEARRA